MIVEDLKKSILNELFIGKTATNNTLDSSVDLLIDSIKNKQKKLLKDKIIKVGKYNTKIDKKSLPSIPNNWRYVKIGDISNLVTKQTGFDYSKNIKPFLVKDPLDGYIPFIQTRDFSGKIFNYNTVYYAPLSLTHKFPNITLNSKSILLSIVGASIGNVGLYDSDNICLLGGAIARIVLTDDRLYDYIYWYLQSPIGYNQIMKNYKSTAQGTITVEDVRNIVVPLPPLEEQIRIVNIIELLFDKLDDVKVIEEEIKIIKESFPKQMKKSILKSAFSGDLVNEKPKMMKFDDCFQSVPDKQYQIKQKEIKTEGLFPVVSQSQNIIEGYTDEFSKLFKHDSPVLVYGDHSNNIKYIDFDFVVGADGTKILNGDNSFDMKYLYYNVMFNINFIPNKGYTRHYKYLKELPISYFSIETQREIVNKIEKILPLCNDIERLVNE